MMTGADKTVNKLLDVLQFGENGESITSDSKKLAREMMTKLGNPAAFSGMKKTVEMTSTPVKFKFTLQNNGTVLAKFTLDNGNSFSIDTGLGRDGLVDKAVKVLNAAANPPKAEKPRVEEKKSDDDIMKAIDELESGEIAPEETEPDETEPVTTETEKEKGTISKETLLGGLNRVFNALKEAKGQDAKKVRDAHAQMAERVDKQTGTTTTERRNASMVGMANRSICDECKKMAAGDWENVTFYNDISRKLNVTLPNGEKLSNEFEKARDQLSSL